MRKLRALIPYLVIALLTLAALNSLFNEDSYGRLQALRRSLAAQKSMNVELEDRVRKLKQKVSGLRRDDRELEKAARNELGLARPNEMIFFFEKKAAPTPKGN